MVIFLVLLLVPMMIQHVAVSGKYIEYQKRNRIAICFFFVMLCLLTMLRHSSVGTDTSSYIEYFELYGSTNWYEDFNMMAEPGFLILIRAISLITDSPQVYIAIVSAIVCVLIYPTYKRLCVDASLTIVLYCSMSTFVMMFSGIRQMLAIAIGFVAYEYTQKRKVLPFLITVFIAILFHNSAFMLLFMYPLYHLKITKKLLWIVLPLLAITFIFNAPIFDFLCDILEEYTRFSGNVSSTGAYTMLILFVVFVLFSYIIPDESSMDKETIGLRNFLLLSLVIQMFTPLHTLAMRMSYYYIIFIPLLLPKIIQHKSKRLTQVAVFGRHVMVAFFFLYFFVYIYGGKVLDVFPYHFFWESV